MTATTAPVLDEVPPTPSHAPWTGTVVRCPTTAVRPSISPRLVDGPEGGVAPDDPYVRRVWVAALGAGAVADLLRLVAGARVGRALKRPLYLHVLVAERLVWWEDGTLCVPATIPRLGHDATRRLRPSSRMAVRRVAAPCAS
jgi:hypothetical protein